MIPCGVFIDNTMNMVYIVIENGTPYPSAYSSFSLAVFAAKEKHKKAIEEELKEAEGGPICSDVDVPENTESGKTSLYIEKGIYIEIYRLPILSL